ncbi:MAG: hypothetical protein ACKVYV_09215 [Limisphaerales bacterium]
MRRAAQWTVAMVLALSLGLHWAVLQTAAWAGMLASYSRQTSFAEAVAWTFDGQHPCRVCKLVEAGRSAGGEQPLAPVRTFKLDPATPASAATEAMVPATEPEAGSFPWPAVWTARTETPPVPPPRFA